MADFNSIKRTTRKYFDKAVVGANNMVETTKRYAEKSQASQKLSSMYERLGKAYYMQEMGHKDEKMLIKMLMKQIEEANAEFSEAKKKLNESMAKKCEKCGYKNPSNSNFCLNCGSKIEKE